MADRRSRLDFAAYGLLVAGLVVALSVFSYDPADPPGGAVYPPHETAKNILGSGGAWLARTLHETLGIAVHILLASWFVLVVLLFLRQSLVRWSLRLLGWLLLIPCAAVAADYFSAYLPPGPLAGGGGSLGAWLRSRLEASFQPLGAASVFGASVFLGLVLTADFLLVKIAGGVWLGALWLGRRTLELCRRLKVRRPGESTLVFTEASPFAAPAVQIRSDGESSTPPPPKAGEIPIRHHDLAATTLQAPGGADVLLASQRATVDSDGDRFADFELPALSLLAEPQPFPYEEHDQRLRERAALLEKTFRDFGLNIWVVGINTGPVITQYEVALETGLRVHKVTGLGDDLALNLKVPSVRIVAPIPGKNTVGIEIPNEHRAVVRLKEVILAAGQRVAQAKIPLFLGKDTEGRPLVYDLAEMPHLLIAGRTGTGKSVCMNAIILSILMTRRPDDVKMVMIDPKMLELSEYGRIPHLMHPVVKDMKKAEAILSWAVDKMEERYDLLSRARVRGIAGYNELSLAEIYRRVQPADDEERRQIPAKMPYIAIFVDELNDLMMTMKKEVEGHIIRLAQKSRAAGIHLVVATQKPTVDVITGLIKSNLPARICFQVSSRTDSRVVLDEMGADKLLGKGDMLFLQPGTSTLLRAQGTYASDEEISRVVQNLECEPCYAQELVQLSTSGKDGDGCFMDTLRARDDLYEQAIQVIIREGRGSVSLLQRALGIGYGRAARLIDFMAEDGIVGNYNGSQAREVLYTPEQWEQVKQAGAMH
ncbi:MAG TPA: DNA translocase FtsK 4TM domain-containing protein [Gemmataceae bacterium]|nr:DNA translocase FtsK 4TM domain-containing protein [Gemmataceae bacterium]